MPKVNFQFVKCQHRNAICSMTKDWQGKDKIEREKRKNQAPVLTFSKRFRNKLIQPTCSFTGKVNLKVIFEDWASNNCFSLCRKQLCLQQNCWIAPKTDVFLFRRSLYEKKLYLCPIWSDGHFRLVKAILGFPLPVNDTSLVILHYGCTGTHNQWWISNSSGVLGLRTSCILGQVIEPWLMKPPTCIPAAVHR